MPDTHVMPITEPVKPSRIEAYRRKLKISYGKLSSYVAGHKSGRLLAVQMVCAMTVLVGIAQYSVPIALIIGGVGGILAAERQS
jgi:hypothetical protein